MKIGLLGGSFNPIHLGHLILAAEAREAFSLEKVLFIPSYRTPMKKESGWVAPKHRYAMVRLAVKDHPAFSVSDLEIRRKGVSYSVDTVRALRKRYPRARFYFFVGSDCVKRLSSWKEAETLFRLCRFVIVRRPRFPVKHLPKGVATLTIPQVAISARDLRRRIARGRTVAFQVPEGVLRYIRRHRLYR